MCWGKGTDFSKCILLCKAYGEIEEKRKKESRKWEEGGRKGEQESKGKRREKRRKGRGGKGREEGEGEEGEERPVTAHASWT